MPAFLSLSAYVCACFPMKFIVSLALNESERCNPTQSYNNDSKGQTTALRKRINSFQQQNTEHRRAAIKHSTMLLIFSTISMSNAL